MLRTYSRKSKTASAPRSSAVEEEWVVEESRGMRDADELIGMGAVSRLYDDIIYAIDSLSPKNGNNFLDNFAIVKAKMSDNAEWKRQFRAHEGLNKVFEWYERDENLKVQTELIWLFCAVGGMLRRVDHFCSIGWIFNTAILIFEGRIDDAELLETDPFKNRIAISNDFIAKWFICKACFGGSDKKDLIKSGLLRTLDYISADNSGIAILDLAVSMNVEGCREKALKLTKPLGSLEQYRLLITISGSEKGWECIDKECIDQLFQLHDESDYTICCLSVLINCVDRCMTSEQYAYVMSKHEVIMSLLKVDTLNEQCRQLAALLIAFHLQTRTSTPSIVLDREYLYSALQKFSLMADPIASQTVRRLAGLLEENGWLPPTPKMETYS